MSNDNTNNEARIGLSLLNAELGARIKNLEHQLEVANKTIERMLYQEPVARFSNTAGQWFQVPFDCADAVNVFPLYFRPGVSNV